MSFKNVGKGKAHKERSQPQSRQRFGLLEKKKDYKLRAVDYHRKERAIKNLQRKAAFRNPEEFYFKMVNAVTTVNNFFRNILHFWNLKVKIKIL